jgi:Flp pilus assembly protein TadG
VHEHAQHGRAVERALRRSRNRAGAEDGVALVEFALLLPVLVLLLFGLLDFGKAFNYWIDETHLANEGARWAVVNRNPAPSGTTLQEYIRDQATTPELRDGGTSSVPNALEVCIAFPAGTANVGDPVKVTLESTYRWLGVIADRISVTETAIAGASTMRLEAPPTTYEAGCA